MTVAILGLGAWGTALATVAARGGQRVVLWGRDAAQAGVIEAGRVNARWLPGVSLGPTISVTADTQALGDADLVLAAVPAQALRDVLTRTSSAVSTRVPIALCCKGIEQGTGLLMSEVARQVWPEHPVAALSGPSFAADVGRGLPTAVTLAAADLEQAATLAARLAAPHLRLYGSDDLRGVEIGGAVKNVLAIACGIASGRELGASAVAALTARAFAELLRYGRAEGARAETLMGLSGFGDLVLTCGSPQSRNFSFGAGLGRGASPEGSQPRGVVEGAATAPILAAKAQALGVDMPIVQAVAAILAGRADVDTAIDALLSRPFKAED